MYTSKVSMAYSLSWCCMLMICLLQAKARNRLKAQLSRTFEMKDLGAGKHILGMEIHRDRKNGKLWLSQQKYVEKVLEKFNMNNVKPVNVPLASHFKISSDLSPRTNEEK